MSLTFFRNLWKVTVLRHQAHPCSPRLLFLLPATQVVGPRVTSTGSGLTAPFLTRPSRQQQGRRHQVDPKQAFRARTREKGQISAKFLGEVSDPQKTGHYISKEHPEPFFKTSSCEGINIDHYLVHTQTRSPFKELHSRY